MRVSLSFLLAVQFFAISQANQPDTNDSQISKLSRFLSKKSDPTQSLFASDLTDSNNFNQDTSESSDIQSEGSIPIMTLPYYGNWKTTMENLSQFNFFDQESGFAKFWAEDNETLGIDNNLFVVLYNGEYIDQKYVVFNYIYDNDTDFNPENATFSNSSIIFSITKYNNFEQVSDSFVCEGAYQLSFINSQNSKPYNMNTMNEEYFEVVALFWLNSSNCSINLSANVAVTDENRDNRAMDYSIMVTILCVVHLYSCMQLIKVCTQSDTEGQRISLITIGFLTAWDIFLCLFHLFEALSITDFFHYFITPAFWYFILGTIFETRLLMLIWKSHNHGHYQVLVVIQIIKPRHYQGSEKQCPYFMFNFVICFAFLILDGLLTLFIFLCYYFLPEDWFFYGSSLFFVPQIIHNCKRGRNYKFNHQYIWLFSFARTALPIYVKGCPASVFQLTPDLQFVEIYSGILAFQVLVLFLQSKLGSRFFIPTCFLAPKFNYFVKISKDSPCEDACSICMEYLNHEPENNTTHLLSKGNKNIKLMETPCKHRFHETCLKAWLDIKFECPFCRSKLPPLE